MRLSPEKDLLLVITISLAVLIISEVQLIKGDTLTFLQNFAILLIPGYASISAIWPTDERINWTMHLGISFILGLLFVLFLPLILESLNLKFITSNLAYLLLITAIILSLVAMIRRSGVGEESQEKDSQLTLEESIQRLKNMDQKAGNSKFMDHKYKKEPSETTNEHIDIKLDFENSKKEPDKYDHLKEEKPIQYARVHREDYIDIKPNYADPYGNRPVKKDPSQAEYEAMMYKPVWMDEFPEKKSPFKFWDILSIIFISSVSLMFLYFNPQNASTSIIFSVLLLFIMGYASLIIIFPDKSRVTLRNLIIKSGIIAIILFLVSFLAGALHLLPFTSHYLVQVLLVASIILLSSAFLRKWQSTKMIHENDVTDEKGIMNKYKKDEEHPDLEETIKENITPPPVFKRKL